MIKRIYKHIIPEKIRIDIIFLINNILSPIYSGNRYYCNCCNKKFRRFLSKGNIKRKNAKCPYCGSLERTRLLHLYLLNETDLFKKHQRVLHVAPERCLYDILKKLDIEYIDGDINPAYATNIIDITNIQYPDNYFDLIICSHVLAHVPDEAKAIRELRRVLKIDGTAIILTLINSDSKDTIEDGRIVTSDERLKNYGESNLYRLHGLDFADRLRKQRFVLDCIDYRRELPREIVSRNSLGDGSRELIYRCRK